MCIRPCIQGKGGDRSLVARFVVHVALYGVAHVVDEAECGGEVLCFVDHAQVPGHAFFEELHAGVLGLEDVPGDYAALAFVCDVRFDGCVKGGFGLFTHRRLLPASRSRRVAVEDPEANA